MLIGGVTLGVGVTVKPGVVLTLIEGVTLTLIEGVTLGVNVTIGDKENDGGGGGLDPVTTR
jgi:hypothetical protein